MEYNQETMEQFLKLLSENGRAGQAEDLSRLLFYMDGMSRQLDAVRRELQAVKEQIAQAPDTSRKNVLQDMADRLQRKVQQAQEKLEGLREKIVQCAASAVENFKRAGVTTLDKAVSAMGIHKTLEAVQQTISSSLEDTKKGIEKIEKLGHELRSAGGHLKNAGRAMVGRETQAVDGGQEGRFQAAVLTPMRTVHKLLSSMNNTTLAAIGNVERLETAADVIRETKKSPVQHTENTEKEPERKAEPAENTRREKPSIRQTLNEKKAEAAARPVPEPERKAPEAAR